jgi:N4-gp56 family major capsid protein
MKLSELMGAPGSGMPIMVDKILVGRPGDQVIFELDQPLSGAGQGDDGTLEGNEESMSFWNMPIVVHERANAVRSNGIMTDKRSAINILTKGFYALNRWAAEQVENDLIYALCGLGNQNTYAGEGTSSIETVNEIAPSSNRILYGGETAAGSYTSESTDSALGDGGASDYANYLFGTNCLTRMRQAAQLATPKIQPVNIHGAYYYIVIMHPLQRKALRAQTGSSGFAAIVQAAWNRGISNYMFRAEGSGKERMFNGCFGVFDDMILFESERMPTRVGGEVFDNGDTIDSNVASGTARVARAALVGQSAVAMCMGKDWERRTENFDYNRKPGVGTDAIYGVRKVQFRDPGASQSTNTAGEDYGVILHDTCVAD